MLSEIKLLEFTSDLFVKEYPDVKLITGKLESIFPTQHYVRLGDGRTVSYGKLCICVGSAPKQLLRLASVSIGSELRAQSMMQQYDPRSSIHTLRDSDSIEVLRMALRPTMQRNVGMDLQKQPHQLMSQIQPKLRVVVLGNGGIAMETVHMLLNDADENEIQWVVKDNYIGNTFFDASVSAFMFPTLQPYMSGLLAPTVAPALSPGLNNGSVNDNCDSGDGNSNPAGAAVDAVIYKSSSDPSTWNTNVGTSADTSNVNVCTGANVAMMRQTKNTVCSGAAVGPGWLLQCGMTAAHTHTSAVKSMGGQLQIKFGKVVSHVLVRRPLESLALNLRAINSQPLSIMYPECFKSIPLGVRRSSGSSSSAVAYNHELVFTRDLLASWLCDNFCWETAAPDTAAAVHLTDEASARFVDLSADDITSLLTTSTIQLAAVRTEVSLKVVHPSRRYGILIPHENNGESKDRRWHENNAIFNVLKLHNHIEYTSGTDPRSEGKFESLSVAGFCLFPVYLRLLDAEIIGCDVCITGIGVLPQVPPFYPPALKTSNENELLVDTNMKSLSYQDVYAAGDCCTVHPEAVLELRAHKDRPHSDWFQMRLWSQARNMGLHAAQCMCGVEEEYGLRYHIFDLFVHVSHFFDYKVVLLGRYNGQGLNAVMAAVGANSSVSATSGIENITKQIVVTADGLQLSCGGINSQFKETAKIAMGDELPKDISGKSSGVRAGADGESIGRTSTTTTSGGGDEYEIYSRITPEIEFVKLVVHSSTGTIVGALLVSNTKSKDGKAAGGGSGNSDIEETIEHLMRNKIDVIRTLGGINMLDPNIDIEDFFD